MVVLCCDLPNQQPQNHSNSKGMIVYNLIPIKISNFTIKWNGVLTLPGSRMTEAVRPAALEPLPEVYTPIGATFSTNLSSCDLAVPGSPRSNILMSPRRVRPSGSLLRDPGAEK